MNAVLDRPAADRFAPAALADDREVPAEAAYPLPPGWPADWPPPNELSEAEAVAELHTGACLTQPVFHALYECTPPGFSAELVEGVVYVASPLSRRHGLPHFKFGGTLSMYEDHTRGIEGGDNVSVALTGTGESQPDLYLRIRRDHGGRSRTFSVRDGVRTDSDDEGDYLTAGPEFVLEVARSSRTLDLNGKRRDYRAGGVQEYVIADVSRREMHWFDFAAGTDAAVPIPGDGVVRSRSMPGLWLNGPALFARRGKAARETLRAGLATPEHAAFVAKLAAAKAAADAAHAERRRLMRVLVTAGPTREYLDDVRYLSNASSGRMGYAVAAALAAAGHECVLVSGPVALPPPPGCAFRPVETTAQMRAASESAFADCDGVIAAAAVCDYRPAVRVAGKIKKDGGPVSVELIQTDDVLASLGAAKRDGRDVPRWVVGFALEAANPRENALQKLRAKHCDRVVLNGPASIGGDSTTCELIAPDGRVEAAWEGTKAAVAGRLVGWIDGWVRSGRPA